jgi:hypothetical protein
MLNRYFATSVLVEVFESPIQLFIREDPSVRDRDCVPLLTVNVAVAISIRLINYFYHIFVIDKFGLFRIGLFESFDHVIIAQTAVIVFVKLFENHVYLVLFFTSEDWVLARHVAKDDSLKLVCVTHESQVF